MGEFEFKQQNLRKLEAGKDALVKQFNEALGQRDYFDTTAKRLAGALELIDSQIKELKADINTPSKDDKKTE